MHKLDEDSKGYKKLQEQLIKLNNEKTKDCQFCH